LYLAEKSEISIELLFKSRLNANVHPMPPRVTESKERVLIEGIPRLEWGKGMDTSFIRSCQVALNSLGEHYSYDYLMGISGTAFRFHFHPEWCPSAADATTGFSVAPVLFDSLGYQYDLLVIDDHKFSDIQKLYQRIIRQINSGIPIVAINLKVCPEWGVITGYLKNRPGILCRTFFDDSENYSLAEHAPWLSFFIQEKQPAPAGDIALKNALEHAVVLAETKQFEDYLSGFHALETWISSLRTYTSSAQKVAFDQHEVNLTLYISLLDTRRAAATFMSGMGGFVDQAEAITHVYRQEVELLEAGRANSLPSFEADTEAWTPYVFRQQIEILEKVLHLEKEACTMIREALKV
jgi:hypothetical protein